MSVNLNTIQDAARGMTTAMASGDTAAINNGWEQVCTAISQNCLAELKADMASYEQTHDKAILEKRGMHPLTSEEKKFYNRMIDVMKSSHPQSAFIDIISEDEDVMPETIIEDVLRNITQEHPLLSRVHTEYVNYMTRWILNTHTAQLAAWGTITAEITQEITSGIKVIDLKQNKLSCYAILEQGMIDLGPEWLESYVRACLTEAISYALETAVVSGDGSNCPIGMDRDLDSESSGAYSQKTATAVTDLMPDTYGELVATLAKDENGKDRSTEGLALIVNNATYYKRIFPATTVLNNAGQYVNSAFPVATDVIKSTAMEDDYAILGVPENYFLGIGRAARNNAIQYSDEYRFLEDQRVFKIVSYAAGRAIDNTAFLLLDVSGLTQAYINVKTVSE